jgi:hypothetical protein
MKKQFITGFIFTILTSFLLLSACQNSVVTPTNQSSNPSSTPEENTVTPVLTEEEPTATPKTLFFITNTTDQSYSVITISDFLLDFSSSNGFLFRESSSQTEITPQTNDIVVVLENAATKFDSTLVKPGITYVVYTLNNNSLPPEILQIKQNPAEQIFLAGYVSALIADDWRMGGILPNQTISNTSFEQIFKNGAHYLCGRCTPVYAPVVVFPVTGAVESSINVFEVYSQLETDRINVLYIPNQFLTNELFATLRENQRLIISDSPPTQENDLLADIYVYQDYVSPLNEILLGINNTDKTVLSTKLTIQDVTQKLSVGKQNFIQQVIINLEKGFLSPYTITEN